MSDGPARLYVAGPDGEWAHIGDGVIPPGIIKPGDRVRIVATGTLGRRCPHCLGTGIVCEDHPACPWAGLSGTVEGHADCGAPGMPCPYCCSPVPEDGTHSITEAFTPDWQRRC